MWWGYITNRKDRYAIGMRFTTKLVIPLIRGDIQDWIHFASSILSTRGVFLDWVCCVGEKVSVRLKNT